MLGSIEEFLLDTEPQIETLIKTLSASPTDAAIAPSAYMKLVELFNKVFLYCLSVINVIKQSFIIQSAPSANIDTSFDIDTQILLKRSSLTQAYH